MKPLHDPLWATPILRSTGNPEDWPKWDQEIRDNYIAACAFDTPPGAVVEIIEDVPGDAPVLD